MKYLNAPSTTFAGKAGTILLGYIFMLIYMISMSHFTTWLYPPPPGYDSTPSGPVEQIPVLYTIFISMIWAPFWEEMVHRHAFGLIVKRIGSQFLLPTMILSSFLFGVGHDNGTQMNMLHQGMMGMVFFYVYAKNGYSVLSSIILHSAWNATVFLSPTWIW